jgi:hypothetical protein
MADETDKPAPVIVEQIPSVAGGMSAIANAVAPVIFFDAVPTFGHYNGIAHMTLSTMRFLPVAGKVAQDNMIVAHLRMNMVAMKALKEAIAAVELLAQSVPEGAKN